MALVQKSVLVNHSAEKMFNLVNQVEHYPEFLPWCGGVVVHERFEKELLASIEINYHGIKQSFATRNTFDVPRQIELQLVRGPFHHLSGRWQFTALSPGACKITFDLSYQFSSRILERLIGPIFDRIANSFVDAFCARADQI